MAITKRYGTMIFVQWLYHVHVQQIPNNAYLLLLLEHAPSNKTVAKAHHNPEFTRKNPNGKIFGSIPWHCHGIAMAGAMAIPWQCRGIAMVMPWHYHGIAMALLRQDPLMSL